MSDTDRKFKITIEIPKADDKDKKDKKEFTISLESKLFDEKKDINYEHEEKIDGKICKITGKAEKGWFSDGIGELKVELDGTKIENPKLVAEQWRYKGPIAVGLSLLVIVMLFVWWWMSSSKESKEEEGL